MLIVAAVFTVALILSAPIAFAIGFAGFSYFLLSDFLPTSIAVQKIASATQSFPLLAVPFFVLAGHLMNKTGITDSLLTFSKVLVSWISGGLAQVSIILSALMGGISGSAVSDAVMEARILGKPMEDHGYDKGYSACVIAFSSLICATIPPSIGLILYGFLANVSIGKLFLAGIIPGILMAIFLMGGAYIIAKRRGYKPETTKKPTLAEIVESAWTAKYALLFPVILICGIRFGIFTPSEAGAVAVVYALLIGFFVHGKLTFKDMVEALEDSISDIGMIMFIIMLSATVGYAVIYEQAPDSIAHYIATLTTNKYAVLALVLLFLLIIGMVIESTVNVLLLTPILVPIIVDVGIDPIHFGILMMILVTMGSMTPPVGVAMYAVCSVLKCPTEKYVVESIPFVLVILALVALLAIFPSISLFLPNILM